eukprot:15375867-Heterocapsa_arctica.AAC.1
MCIRDSASHVPATTLPPEFRTPAASAPAAAWLPSRLTQDLPPRANSPSLFRSASLYAWLCQPAP